MSYAAGYSSGYSSGKSAGRSEARAQFREAEQDSLARVLAAEPRFRDAVVKANEKIRQHCRSLDQYATDGDMKLTKRGGFLWLFTQEAAANDSEVIKGHARKLLEEKFLAATGDCGDDGYADLAEYCLENLETSLGRSYELGQAVEFAASLTEEDYIKMGFQGRLARMTEYFAGMAEDDDAAWELIEAQNDTDPAHDKAYRKFLASALQQYAPDVVEKLKTITDDGHYASRKPGMAP